MPRACGITTSGSKRPTPRRSNALLFFEQPTGRDITIYRYEWHPIGAIKPVLLDEGLTSLELMHEALAQGWTGFALKTCKGHSFALTAAAWAKEHNNDLVVAGPDEPRACR